MTIAVSVETAERLEPTGSPESIFSKKRGEAQAAVAARTATIAEMTRILLYMSASLRQAQAVEHRVRGLQVDLPTASGVVDVLDRLAVVVLDVAVELGVVLVEVDVVDVGHVHEEGPVAMLGVEGRALQQHDAAVRRVDRGRGDAEVLSQRLVVDLVSVPLFEDRMPVGRAEQPLGRAFRRRRTQVAALAPAHAVFEEAGPGLLRRSRAAEVPAVRLAEEVEAAGHGDVVGGAGEAGAATEEPGQFDVALVLDGRGLVLGVEILAAVEVGTGQTPRGAVGGLQLLDVVVLVLVLL